MKPLIKSPGSNNYCVPTALAFLLEVDVNTACELLKKAGMGDIEIQGVYYPLAIKVLQDKGYEVKRLNDELNWRKLPNGAKFLILFPLHAAVVENGYLYDNRHPEGILIKNHPHKGVIRNVIKFEVFKLPEVINTIQPEEYLKYLKEL